MSLDMKRIFTAVLVSAALAGCVRQENLEGQHKAVFKASVESEQTKLGAGVNEDAGVVSFFWTKSDAVAVNTSDGFVPFALKG